MNNPVVDILILNRNYSHFLEDAIESCLNQTYKNINIIIADDNYTDDSRKIIREYHKKNSNIKKIFINYGSPNIAKTRNKLISQSKSEYCCFLSSDDYFHERFIEKSMEELKKRPEASGIYSNFNWVTSDKSFIETISRPSFCCRASLHETVITPLFVVSFESTIFKKEVFNSGLYFHEDVHHGEESIFICEATQYFFFVKNTDQEPLAFKRKHEQAGHVEYLSDVAKWDKILVEKIKERVKIKPSRKKLI